MNKIFLFLASLFFVSSVLAQSGVPYVQNFTKKDYAAAGQNWAVATDADGAMYIGNSKGLLHYNGAYWQLHSLPKGNYVRSILITPDERIYTGSFEEFGFFSKDRFGQFNYTSLSDQVKDYTFHNDEIWDIVSYNNHVYFRSFSSFFVYDGISVSVVQNHFITLFLKELNNQLYVFHQDKGLGQWNDSTGFTSLIPLSGLNNDVAVTILPHGNNSLLIPSLKNGLFLYDGEKCVPWQNAANDLLKKETINKAIITKDSIYVIGTITNGVYAIDKNGELKWTLNTSKGLQNNTVLGIGCDNDNNIWLALDNGISYIRSNSQLRFINAFKQNIGSVFSSMYHNEYLYLATNQGLFYCKKNDELNPILMHGMSEQALSLTLIDDQLICGHNSGTYEIIGTKAVKMSDVTGGTTIQKAVIQQKEVLIQSTYTYLNIYVRNQVGKWVFSHSIPDFVQPIRHLEVDMEGNIWAAHYYKGLFSISLTPDLKKTQRVNYYPYLNNEGFKTTIDLFKMRGRVIFNDNEEFYTYDDLKNKITKYESLNEKLKQYKGIRKAIAVNNNQYWCIRENEFIKIEFVNDTIEIKKQIPFSYFNSEIPDYEENIIPIDNQRFIFCLNNGITILDESIELYPATANPTIQIASVELFSAASSHYLPIDAKSMPKIDFKKNNIRFAVNFNHFPGNETQYQYQLEGLTGDVPLTTPEARIEYNRLSPGKYTLHVKAIDNLGNEMASTQYAFEIAPPFYASKTAIFIYVLLTLLIIYVIYRILNNYLRKSGEKIAREQEKLHKEEQERQEQELIRMKNKNLENELLFKSKELASSTMLLINKNEVLLDIKNELEIQKEKLGTQFPNKYYNKLIKLIDSNLSSENDWEIFQANFDRIHENFFRHLKANYPDLTPNDLKLCAFLRLNLTTKDMANFLGITIRGVEVARYRLRKKLNLSSEKNLVEFMIEFK